MLYIIKEREKMTTSPEPNVPYQSGSVVPYASSQSTLESNVPYAVVAHDLVRTFGQKVAVNHLNLAVRQGEFFGFLGPNGAGKSTTIKMLVGLLRPSAGSTLVAGVDVWKEPLRARALMGVLPEYLNLYERLS